MACPAAFIKDRRDSPCITRPLWLCEDNLPADTNTVGGDLGKLSSAGFRQVRDPDGADRNRDFPNAFAATNSGQESGSLAHAGTAGRAADVAIDGQNLTIVYYGIESRIFKSADGGASWNDITPAIPSVPANANNAFQSIAMNLPNPVVIQAVMYPYLQLSSLPRFFSPVHQRRWRRKLERVGGFHSRSQRSAFHRARPSRSRHMVRGHE